ncbi:MAG: hypothetical protein AAF799_38870 [Myxococcota bacterium]
MRRIELVVGMGLLLGPLAYALTLEPQTETELVIVHEVAPAPEAFPQSETIPVLEPAAEAEPAAAEPAPEPIPEDAIAFAFVNEAGIVLDPDADPSWGKGRLRGHPGPAEYRAAKRADGTRVPAELWAQRGRTFDLYGREGKLCTVRIGDLSVLAQHNGPDLYEVFAGDGVDPIDWDTFDPKSKSRRQIRHQVWRHTTDFNPWLVAEPLDDESCEGALWARDSRLPAPVVLTRSMDANEHTGRRLAQFATSEELASNKSNYEEYYAELDEESREYYDEWDSIAAEHAASAWSWRDAQGVTQLVEMTFGVDEEGCGEGYSTLITNVDRVVDEAFVPTELMPNAVTVFDADNDGQWEALYDHSWNGDVNYLESATLEAAWDILRAYECPC